MHWYGFGFGLDPYPIGRPRRPPKRKNIMFLRINLTFLRTRCFLWFMGLLCGGFKEIQSML
jgi:hypothetical protein